VDPVAPVPVLVVVAAPGPPFATIVVLSQVESLPFTVAVVDPVLAWPTAMVCVLFAVIVIRDSANWPPAPPPPADGLPVAPPPAPPPPHNRTINLILETGAPVGELVGQVLELVV
jgi:hypothetical protein